MDTFGLYQSKTKAESYTFADKVARVLIDKNVSFVVCKDLFDTLSDEVRSNEQFVKIVEFEEFHKYVDAVISLGGDGTMLDASKKFFNKDIPILGINVGRLGFLAEFQCDDLEGTIDKMLRGEYRVVNRSFFEATTDDGSNYYALNDVVIEKAESRLLTINAYASEHLVATYRADGLIVSTPTGSTAYSLSCGGPVIHPATSVMCLTPISPHTLTLRPLIVPDDIEITIIAESGIGSCKVSIDGQTTIEMLDGEKLTIRKSDTIMKMIKPVDSSYYDLLSRKLLWAANSVDCREKSRMLNKQ